MPNTPCLVGETAAAMSLGAKVSMEVFYVGPGSPTRFEPWCQHITSQNTSQFGHRHLEYGRERTQHMTCEREGSPSPPDSMHEPAVDSTGLAAQAVGCVSSCPKALVPGFVQSKTQRSIGITPLHRDVGLNPIRLGSGGHRGFGKTHHTHIYSTEGNQQAVQSMEGNQQSVQSCVCEFANCG